MTLLRSRLADRRAAIAPLTAVLLIPLLAVVAFAIDIGWIVVIQSDLQNAADAAALAGANKMMDGYVKYNLPNQSATAQASVLATAKANATASAKQFAGYNSAGVASLTLLDSDIEYGFTDASGAYTASASGSTTYPNTIKVALRRDGTANTSLGLFFGPVLGKSTQDLKATAAATIDTAPIDSFQNTSSVKVALLPVTYDVNDWNNFLQTGQDPDSNISTDSSGNPDLSVYPSVKDSGNFGLLGLDDSHAGASTVSSWITSGLTQTEVTQLLSASANDQTALIPLSQHNQNILPANSTDGMGSWNWVGDTGMKTSVVHTLNNYVGTTFLLPLFKPLDPGSTTTTTTTDKHGNTVTTTTTTPYSAGNGNGSHYYYNIVQFVSVKLISADDKSVVVEPTGNVVDLNSVLFGSQPTPAGTGTGASATLQTTFTPPKLTQ